MVGEKKGKGEEILCKTKKEGRVAHGRGGLGGIRLAKCGSFLAIFLESNSSVAIIDLN